MTSPVDWVKFFEGAEIPHVTALEYAVTFADQRISFDMLADLDKEYLKDMGIVRTGDVINILKHAKVFDARLASQKAAKQTVPVPVEPKKKPPTTATKNVAPAREVRTVVDSSKQEPRKVVLAPEPGVTQRLGPPVAKPFPNVSKQSKEEKHGVFSRLGAQKSEKVDTAENSAASQSATLAEKPETILISQNPKVALKRKPILSSNQDDSANSPKAPTPVIAKRRLVLVKTLPDGSKVKEVISPDDPIVQRIPIHKIIVARPEPRENFTNNTQNYKNVDSKPTLTSDRFESTSMKDRSSPKPPTDAKSRLGPAKASCLPRAVGGIQGRLAPKKYEEEVVRKEFKRITPSRETPTIKTSASLAKRLGEKKVSSDDRLARERSPHGRYRSTHKTAKSIHDRLG